ncbi:MAG TPA: hypothetical protein VK007_11960 [Acidimicrobiales bacterium]|nr:hypothetical protein [Acidimicrobiales bacterium]
MASRQTLSVEERRVLAAWAAGCAEGVLTAFGAAAPSDGRVRAAIDQARAFAAGELPVDEAIRRRGGQAGAAARAVRDPAARAAAYAAEQAAAVAHMGAHALGAAGYAAKAAALAAPDDDAALARAVDHQLGLLTDDARRALAALPRLGEDRAGPLAPGRLSTGLVGAAIRLLQSRTHPEARQ